MKAVEKLFRSGPLAFVALEHARDKRQRLPKITISELAPLLARWDTFEPKIREIDHRLNALNVFAAVNTTDYETRHSNFLAWLLSPMQSHGIGDGFLTEFLTCVLKKRGDFETAKVRRWASGAVVERERFGRVDLVILNRQEKFICVVENKIHAGEHTNQLKRYREAIEREFPDYGRAFVFLSLRAEAPSDSQYVAITYSELSDSLKRATPESKNVGASLPFLLQQYDDFLSGTSDARPNLFAALQLREIKHSDFYAWLFNPGEAHGLGLGAFSAFLEQITLSSPKLSLPTFRESDFADIEIRREEYNIDLLIVSERAKFVCAIENKLESREGNNQLARYRAYVQEWFPNFHHLFVFFTLRGESPSDPAYVKLTFGEYARAIRGRVLANAAASFTNADILSLLLNDYGRLLSDRLELRMKTRIELAPALAHKCAELFQAESKAVCGMLAFVRRWQESVRDEVEDFIGDLIQRVFPGSFRSPRNNPRFRAYMAFVPPEIDAILPVKSSAPKRLFDLMFMSFPFTNPFQNAESLGVTIICTIRKADPHFSRLRNEIYSIAQKSPALFNLANREDIATLENCRILSYTLVTRDDFLATPLEDVKQKLEQKLRRFKEYQYPKILALLKTAVENCAKSK